MATPSDGLGSPVFERIEEYKAVLENLSWLSSRRQNANNMLVGVNTLFLTGLGIFLLSTHLMSWWLVVPVGVIAAAMTPINLSWVSSLRRYEKALLVRFTYLQEIEQEFRELSRNERNGPPIGLYLRLKDAHLDRVGMTLLELRIATYLLVLFPVLAIAVAILTYLVTHRMLPPPAL